MCQGCRLTHFHRRRFRSDSRLGRGSRSTASALLPRRRHRPLQHRHAVHVQMGNDICQRKIGNQAQIGRASGWLRGLRLKLFSLFVQIELLRSEGEGFPTFAKRDQAHAQHAGIERARRLDAFNRQYEMIEGQYPACCRSRSQASKFSAKRLLLEHRQSGLQIVGQCGRMIQRAGVQPESTWLVAPGFVDGPLQKPLA